jgi:hypothetical protein
VFTWQRAAREIRSERKREKIKAWIFLADRMQFNGFGSSKIPKSREKGNDAAKEALVFFAFFYASCSA